MSVVLLLRFALAGTLAAAAMAASTAPVELEFELYNRTYADVATGDLEPLRFDPVTIRLSSPHQAVVVRSHRIRLSPLGGGRFSGSAEIELLGKGDLIVDLDLGGGQPSQMSDQLVVPLQRLAVDLTIAIRRATGGYRVVVESLPAAVQVEVRSRLVGDVLEACAGFSLLTLGSLDCDPIAEALERPRVPLPGPGTELWLADADLTAADRAELDALLAAR